MGSAEVVALLMLSVNSPKGLSRVSERLYDTRHLDAVTQASPTTTD